MNKKFDLAQDVTNKILTMMETSGSDWLKPWVNSGIGFAKNAQTGKHYNGINVFLTSSAMQSEGWKHPLFATYKQWQSLGCKVKPGQKSKVYVVFWTLLERDAVKKDGTEYKKNIPYLRYSPVFNVDQVEGYKGKLVEPEPLLSPEARQLRADRFIKDTGANIVYGREHACYIPAYDLIEMPDFKQFKSSAAYYGVHFHELTHWTGSEKRVDRDLSGRFGDESYAFEELIAEMGSAMLSVHLNVTGEPRDDHAKYLNSWLKVLKSDKTAIIKAASEASKAIQYMIDQVESATKQAVA